jgi:poly-beta-1,6-N-acetyl-D-glucosamine synthase
MPFNFLEIVITYGITFVFILQLGYWWYAYLPLLVKTPTDSKKSDSVPVSVIVCAKNEVDNLRQFLPLLLQQDYPCYEVIVVDDGSEDDTIDLLRHFKTLYPQLRIATIENDEHLAHGKKWALTIGIKAAQYDCVVLTDADCYPTSNQWLKLMQSAYEANTEIVLGYGKYQMQPGFLNAVIRYDTFVIGITYLSYAIRGNAYMGVGRNLAYKKAIFFRHDGFASHLHTLSGDDDLFITQAATPRNVSIQIHPEAFTVSLPKTNWRNWLYQKTRHVSTAGAYNWKIKCLLILVFVLPYLFYAWLITALLIGISEVLVLSFFLLRTALLLVLHFRLSKVLMERGIWYYSIIFEVLFLLIYPRIHFKNRFEKQSKWKN